MNRLRRRLGRVGLRLRYHVLHRHRHQRLVVERVAGHDIVVLPGVMNPALFRTGAYFAQTLDETLIRPGSRVLDMGTGSGVCAVVAASWAGHVVAVDVSPAAIRCARINVLLNEIEECVEVRHGDLFSPVAGARFDVILFNPPFFRGTPGDAFDYAWRATDTVERFAAALPDYLAPGGQALVLLSTDGDSAAFLQAFAECGLRREIVAERDMITEIVTIYRLTPADW